MDGECVADAGLEHGAALLDGGGAVLRGVVQHRDSICSRRCPGEDRRLWLARRPRGEQIQDAADRAGRLEDDTSLVAALRAGARGYVLKGATPEEILRAIRAAAAGQAIFDAGLADRLAGLATNHGDHLPYPFPELSRRERDVLELLAAGHSNPAIATRLSLSEKTVRNNVSAILTKLRAADRPAAIIRAREAGIVTRTDETSRAQRATSPTHDSRRYRAPSSRTLYPLRSISRAWSKVDRICR